MGCSLGHEVLTAFLPLLSWTYNFDEDPYGEVDIIEYAMFDSGNTVSLHTCGACKFDLSGQPGTTPFLSSLSIPHL